MLCTIPSWMLCRIRSSLVDEEINVDVPVTSSNTIQVAPPSRQVPMSVKALSIGLVPTTTKSDENESGVRTVCAVVLDEKASVFKDTGVTALVREASHHTTHCVERSATNGTAAICATDSIDVHLLTHEEIARPVEPALVPLPPSDPDDLELKIDTAPARVQQVIDEAATIKRETRYASSAMQDLGFTQIRVLGAGGCGVAMVGRVFDPKQRGFTAAVIKRTFGIHAEANFTSEVRFLSACQGPGVVEMWGAIPEHRLLSMELLDHSLHDVIGMGFRRGNNRDAYAPVIDPHELCGQLLIAIQHVHSRGVIHRDIKPGNILVRHGRSGIVVKLADFGCATWTESQERHLVGTPGYYAPEQLVTWRGGGCRYGEKVDLWSFGATLYELLAGRQLVDPRCRDLWEGLKTLMNMFDVDHEAWLRMAPEEWPFLSADQMTRVHACAPDRSLRSMLHLSLQWGPELRFDACELLTKFRSMHRPIQHPRLCYGGSRGIALGQRVLHV